MVDLDLNLEGVRLPTLLSSLSSLVFLDVQAELVSLSLGVNLSGLCVVLSVFGSISSVAGESLGLVDESLGVRSGGTCI